MGNCISTSSLERQRSHVHDAALTRDPERQMREAKKQLSHTAKVLLLGTGDSGKSTVLKQLRVINSIPWSSTEIESYRQIIWVNLIEGMTKIRQVIDELSIQASEDTLALFDEVARPFELGGQEAYPPPYQHVFQSLWEDSAVQKAISKGRKLALPDNLSYFFNDLPRLFKPTYVPSTDDIIFARARTMGISEMHFTMPSSPNKKLIMIDVGGQKSERRKWIHCFQDVTAVLFLVSLSGYDQCLVEECNANQMMDAMGVWDSICSSQWFRTTSLILFLNKEDLFRQRIQYSPIRKFFPDYDGPENDADAGMQYFRRRFVRLAHKANRAHERKAGHGGQGHGHGHGERVPQPLNVRQVYSHFTTAVITNHIRIVMGAVNDTILREHFEKSAIL